MGARVRWREDRQAWFIYVYGNGNQAAKRLGPKLADKRRGERLANEANRKQARGTLGLEKPKAKPVPFDQFAERWLRARVQLPFERGEAGHLSPKSVRSHEQQVRLHLIPFLRARPSAMLSGADARAPKRHTSPTSMASACRPSAGTALRRS